MLFFQDCDGGNPLGMSSGEIPDKSIRASTQTAQHPAHHGRLDRNSYWCSGNERRSHIEIDLPKQYKITAVAIEVSSNSDTIKAIALYGHILQEWVSLHPKRVYALEKTLSRENNKPLTMRPNRFMAAVYCYFN